MLYSIRFDFKTPGRWPEKLGCASFFFFQATSRFLQIGSSTGLSRFVVVMYYLNWQKVIRNSTRSFAKFNGNLWVFVSSLWLIHLFEKCYFLTFQRRWILTIIHILFSRISFPYPLTSVLVSKGKTCWDEVESPIYCIPQNLTYIVPMIFWRVPKLLFNGTHLYIRHKRPRGICSLSGSRHYTKDLMESRDYDENCAVVS